MIEILNIENTIKRLQKQTSAVIISIRDKFSSEESYHIIDVLSEKNAQDMLVLYFDDVSHDYSGFFHLPTMEHVDAAIEFARKYSDFDVIVHCTAGISRSSAIAFLIAFDRTGSVEKSKKILNKKHHCPNTLVIRLGEEFFDAEFYEPLFGAELAHHIEFTDEINEFIQKYGLSEDGVRKITKIFDNLENNGDI